MFEPSQRVKVNLSGLTIKQVSAEPSVYLVELLFSFKGIKRVAVPEDRIQRG
jgi:hypothetical protein